MQDQVIKMIEHFSGYENLKEHIDIDLLDSGILDSLAFLELITALEDEFHLEIQPTQVDPNTWRKVDSIVAFVSGRQA